MTDKYGLPARYKNLELIGSGAIGSVLKVTDIQSDCIRALKIIDSTNVALAESLENEFSILSSLSHRNLINVHDYGLSETGHPYFTMDFIDGPHLKKYLNSKSRVIHTKKILSDILSALEYLSDRNIVHGDIKPENILISDEACASPILVDFGFSTLSHSKLDTIFGTPRFLAPEILNDRLYSQKSDIYALGHTIIECITDYKTPLAQNLCEEYFNEISEVLNHTFTEAEIPNPRNLTSFIIKLSNPDINRRPDTTSSAKQQLFHISRTLSDDGISLDSSHISREHIENRLNEFIRDPQSNSTLAILEGPIGSGKKSLMRRSIIQAQLAKYSVLNFIDIPSEGFSLQTIINILSINISPSESMLLNEKHRKLILNMKKVEDARDLDNLGVIYSNMV
jgi:serine/threonine protein kinase